MHLQTIEFYVGNMEPRPKGSHTAFVVNWPRSKPKLHQLCREILAGREFRPQTVVTSASKGQKSWEKEVKRKAVAAMALRAPIARGCCVHMEFFLKRPKGHFGTGRNAGKLKEWAVGMEGTKAQDLDKLIRSTMDAMNGVVFCDDAQVLAIVATKVYGRRPGVKVSVYEIKIPIWKRLLDGLRQAISFAFQRQTGDKTDDVLQNETGN